MNFRLVIIAVIGFLFGCGFQLWLDNRPPQLQPLKVTIIDSGGAKLRVESTVEK